MDPLDLEIQKRLNKLKKPITDSPSEDELNEKLRKLKGISSHSSSNVSNKYIVLAKPRSDVEQTEDLMKQLSAEALLPSTSSTSTSISEVEQRLRNLKSQDEKIKHNDSISRESDTKVLLKKILAEAELEKKTNNKFPLLLQQTSEYFNKDEDMSYSDSDSEDDFCYICDKTPKWICLNCDKEHFCNKCFKEYHDEIGECHQRKAFRRKKKRQSDSD